MRTDEAYVRSLEKRIRNQRAQLRWWQENYQLARLERPKRWSASEVCALLSRLGFYRFRPMGAEGIARAVKARRVNT